jgi:hypothetical protein
MKQEITLSIYKAVCFMVLNLAFMLSVMGIAKAESLTVQCKVFKDGFGNQHSIIAVRSTGIRGKYYVKVVSGGSEMVSGVKRTNKKNVVDFRFDSDFSNFVNHPDTTQIPSDFIKKRKVAGIMRKADNNAYLGGVSTTCTTKKVRTPISP